jgi:nucleoside-diphosphate-sugar epimerase
MACALRLLEDLPAVTRTTCRKDPIADVSLARELLGYESSAEFEDGLRNTIQWCREQIRIF